MAKIVSWLIMLVLLACGETSSHRQAKKTNLSSDSCDNPDANINCSFVNMPVSLTSIMTIADENEPGEKLFISGTVFMSDEITPYPDVIIYAYHTDNTGHYSKKGNESGVQKWHGRLHGWCRTDKNGRYEIHTIRPARYPDNTMPAHIHSAMKEPDQQPFYINDFVFRDDDLVTEKYLSNLYSAGGTGVLELTMNKNGTWEGKRNIVLK